jgi:mono/diheme cytochrome c family protein
MKIAIVLALAFAAPGVVTAQTKAPTVKELYGSMCQACHGPDGKSPIKDMSFVGRKWKHGTKTADMIKVITDGVPGTAMLPFEGRLTEQQIRDLARYVRSLDKTLKPEKR